MVVKSLGAIPRTPPWRIRTCEASLRRRRWSVRYSTPPLDEREEDEGKKHPLSLNILSILMQMVGKGGKTRVRQRTSRCRCSSDSLRLRLKEGNELMILNSRCPARFLKIKRKGGLIPELRALPDASVPRCLWEVSTGMISSVELRLRLAVFW